MDALRRSWGSTEIVSRGRIHDVEVLAAFVCVMRRNAHDESDDALAAHSELAGFATYAIDGEECELVTLDAIVRNSGVGSVLLQAVANEAHLAGCHRMWLITTNDNRSALRFYERRGLVHVATHVGAVDRARSLKPSIPLVGEGGIEIHDELELEQRL